MTSISSTVFFTFLFLSFSTAQAPEPLHLIAFGSCTRQTNPQPAWKSIIHHKPDLWIWLGDVVYADTQTFIPTVWRSPTMDEMQAAYTHQRHLKDYQALVDTCPVIGVWDDHDYGKNDGGAEYVDKEKAKAIFLDFLDVPKDSQQYTRDGIYASYEYGPKGKKVKVILLDVRYFRDSHDILGEQQWKWLNNELKQSDAQVHLIGSGSQVIPVDKPFVDKWAPSDLERLTDIIKKYHVPGVVLLSGDVHHAEIMRNNCSHLGYPLYEITSSGLTHSFASQVPFLGSAFVDYVLPTKYRLGFYAKENYGTIQFNWEITPSITFRIHDVDGSVVLEMTISLGQLSDQCTDCGLDQEGCNINFGFLGWKLIPKWVMKCLLFSPGIPVFLCICSKKRKQKTSENYRQKQT